MYFGSATLGVYKNTLLIYIYIHTLDKSVVLETSSIAVVLRVDKLFANQRLDLEHEPVHSVEDAVGKNNGS